MNTKIIRSLAAALVIAALPLPAVAESLGEHPAVLVARTWSSRGVDPNTFMFLHPAGPIWADALQKTKEKNATCVQPLRMAKVESASNK
jgi:hypothetical protein